MPAELLYGRVERGEVPPNQRGIELSRAHRPKSPRRMRPRRTASIFASCGTQSQ